MRVPSGEIAIDHTAGGVCHEALNSSRSVRSNWPESASQIRMARSKLPETMRLPFGVNATDDTVSESPLMVRNDCPLPASQSLIDLSVLPEISVCPLGEKATEVTAPPCPDSVSRRWP